MGMPAVELGALGFEKEPHRRMRHRGEQELVFAGDVLEEVGPHHAVRGFAIDGAWV